MHIGKNISKIRELLGVKQETLAFNLKISQQTISKIEQTENLRENTVDRIAKALGVDAKMIMNYDESTILQFLQNQPTSPNSHLDEVSEMLLIKIIDLYERLILSEREKSNLLRTDHAPKKFTDQ